MASTQPAPPADRTGRVALLTLVVGGVAMLMWLIASLTLSAFS